MAVDEDGDWVYFTANKQALRERHMYRIKLDGTNLERYVKDPGVHAVTFSPNMKFYCDVYSNVSTPPELAVYDVEGTKLNTLSPSSKNLIAQFNLRLPEFRSFKADRAA